MGKVDHGFDNASALLLQAGLKPLVRKTQPYARKSRIAHSGSSHRCLSKSNIGRGLRRANCAIHFSKDYEIPLIFCLSIGHT